MKKNQFVLSVIIALTCVLLLSGCAPQFHGKTVQLPYPDISSLHPAYWQPQHILAQGSYFEGLFGYAPDPEGLGGVKVVPVMAESWTVSPDGKIWTIKLRKDKKWSNGEPITARDFEWSYRYYCGSDLKDLPLWASPLGSLKNSWAIKAGGVPVEQLGVQALDDYTLRLELADPDFNLQLGLVTAGMVPVYRPSVEKDPSNWWRPANIVCNGPYIPQAWTQGKELVLIKNTNYVGERGNVDRIVLKFFQPGMEFGLQAFQARELDFVFINNVGQFRYVLAKPDLKADLHELVSDLQFQGYEISRCFDPLLDDIRIRQAFAMAIDRQTLAEKILGGRALPGSQIWDPDSVIGRKLRPIGFDVEKAKKLLAEAGYPGARGLPQLTFYITGASDPVSEFIVNEWKKNLGADVVLANLESGLYWSSVWGPSPDLKVGFFRFSGPMNKFGVWDMDKNLGHVNLYFDYRAAVRKKKYDLDKLERNRIRMTADKGFDAADWADLRKKRDEYWAVNRRISAGEPSKLWRESMDREPSFLQQFGDLYAKWEKTSDKAMKNLLWRTAAELVLGQELYIIEYDGRSELNRQRFREELSVTRMPWEACMKNMYKPVQMLQDTYYMVPLYFEKIQYLSNPKLSGILIYKFSLGPQVFNLKYLQLAD